MKYLLDTHAFIWSFMSPGKLPKKVFSILPIDAYDYITFHSLPRKEGHQDPFDQMLVHSALRKNLILISGDKSFKQYETEGLQLMW